MQAALQLQSRPIVKPLRQPAAGWKNELVGEADAVWNARDRLFQEPLELLDGIRSEADDPGRGQPAFGAEALQLRHRGIAHESQPAERLDGAYGAGVYFDDAHDDDIAKLSGKEALDPQQGVYRRTPVIRGEQNRG